jgi:hypothetical protein
MRTVLLPIVLFVALTCIAKMRSGIQSATRSFVAPHTHIRRCDPRLDAAGDVIETHEHAGEKLSAFLELESRNRTFWD